MSNDPNRTTYCEICFNELFGYNLIRICLGCGANIHQKFEKKIDDNKHSLQNTNDQPFNFF